MIAWIRANLKSLREQSDGTIVLHMSAKTLSGLGIGLLLAGPLGARAGTWGVVLLAAGLLTGIYSGHRILRARSSRKTENGAREK